VSVTATAGATRRRIFIVSPPGVEPVTAREIRQLGLTPEEEQGGLALDATSRELYSLNLHLRTASRVLVRVAEFRARTFYELERHSARVPWRDFLDSGRPVRLRVTSRKSRLYHQRAIEQRLLAAIGAPEAPVEDEEAEGQSAQLFIVRFLHDRCVISADSSGALLHLRGYRRAVARAPLRETLAATLLLATGWGGSAPLLDPMCGSGTVPIEAALIARQIPPGLANAALSPRRYAFEHWSDFDQGALGEVVSRARERVRMRAEIRILGSDRDAGAIEASEANAERAGVREDLELSVRPVSAVAEPGAAGWVVTNPPYGVRVGETDSLRDLYATLGKVARRAIPDGTVAMLSADRRLEAQLRIPLQEVLATRNGGISVRIVKGIVNREW
jgi:putative N6-adenine-specific DNA methylase